jgi:hypothetical protein
MLRFPIVLKSQIRRNSNLKNNIRLIPNCGACANYDIITNKCKKYLPDDVFVSTNSSNTYIDVNLGRKDELKCGINGKGFEYINTNNQNLKYSLYTGVFSGFSFLMAATMPPRELLSFFMLCFFSSGGASIGLFITWLIKKPADKYIEYKSDNDDSDVSDDDV